MEKTNKDKIKSSLVATAGALLWNNKSPNEGLGDLFSDVQKQQIYADGKTFADLIPRLRVSQIKKEYLLAQKDPNFDLHEFVSRHFYEFDHHQTTDIVTHTSRTPELHIKNLWSQLTRRNRRNRGSLIALPHAYVVPGGRFNEQFYWDSYFIMLGLAADDEWNLVEMMVKNFAFMLRRFGFIPTANRTYFLSRSQPPLFSQMVRLLARNKGKNNTLIEYLPYLIMEYRFWMKGSYTVNSKPNHRAYRRLVQMPNGVMLGRYFDHKAEPRPESLREDIATSTNSQDAHRLYVDLRAGAESGWDFSSRWLTNPVDITTIHTTDIVPVDLNSLLYQLETTIAETYVIMKQPLLAKRFLTYAERRAKTIREYCWDDKEKFFVDYDFQKNASTGHITIAGVFPLYAKIASSEQAAYVARRIEKDFLKPGGLVTTLIESGQQWDSPNGWAPLQWIAIEGLRAYGYDQLADKIKTRWIKTNLDMYKKKGKFVEKYNVVDDNKLGTGGEYPLQDGFGWTNGVLAALLK
jgi:alpha,alpha-trehalase